MIGMCHKWYLCPLEKECLYITLEGIPAPEYGHKYCMLGVNLFEKKDPIIIENFTQTALKIRKEENNE